MKATTTSQDGDSVQGNSNGNGKVADDEDNRRRNPTANRRDHGSSSAWPARSDY